MRNSRFATTTALVIGLVVLAGCGGGGHGFTVASNPVVITSNSLPPTLSGQTVNYLIPFSGGSGGPYLLELIEGELPDGIGTDNQTVALVGRALEDGVFDFRLKLTDSGSVPFSTTTALFHWEIGIGPLVFATDTVLPGTVYNSFTSIQLVVAGGVPPYSCQVVDLPTPTDEPLPTGLSIPPDSCTIVGAPQQAKPGGAPFFVSIRASDSTPGIPLTVDKTFQLPILIPPIIITTVTLPDGKCGVTYSAQVDVADGVPPFVHSVVDPATDIGVVPYSVSAHRLRGEPGAPNGTAKGSFPSAYKLDSDGSPYTGRFPEGLYFRDSSGEIQGRPRRMGSFVDWMYHVQSTLLPNEASQNKWKAFSFSMTDGVSPNLALDPLSMPTGQGYVAPNNKLPDLEVGVTFSFTFSGVNGVAHDGKYDAPHETEAINKPGETNGKYDWASTTFQVAGRPASLNAQFTADGTFATLSPAGVSPPKGGFENVNLVLRDLQLPVSTTHQTTGVVRFAVGPDSVIFTESSQVANTAPVDNTYIFDDQTVEVYEPYTLTPTVRDLVAADMAATHVNPAGSTLADALKNIDFLSVSVNPTWWAYDIYNLNAQSARGFQHADPERRLPASDYNSDAFQKINNGSMPFGGLEYESNTAIELPETSAVAHNPAGGVYANGGLLYGYDNPGGNEFGFFVVRKDSRIYIPYSTVKSGSATGFGDSWVTSVRTAPSPLRRPQITVSPDGRFAAAKIKADVNNFVELANASRIVIFSLTGEKPFGGQTYKVINTGATGTTNDGQYLYADSLTLTNRYLYWMTGNQSGSTNSSWNSGSNVMFQDHWIWRFDLTNTGGTTGARLNPAFNAEWTNGNTGQSSALATPWHRWTHPGTSSINQSFSTDTFQQSTTQDPSWTNPGITYPAPDFYTNNYANFAPNSLAPTPFRVSRNGRALAIAARPNTTSGTSSNSNFMTYHLWVDWDTQNASVDSAQFRQVTGTARRYRGAARNGGVRKADTLYASGGNKMAGWFDGPATQMEISDDGLRIAGVYNASTATWFQNSGTSNAVSSGNREEVQLISAANTGSTTDPWNSASETAVTAGIFTGGLIWKFGCLAFTRDATGLVFWGGYGLFNPTSLSSTYVEFVQQSGSMYAYNIATGAREGILNKTEGGHTQVTTGSRVYSTSASQQNNLVAANWTGDQGSVTPIGCFYSNDGKFFWLESYGALTTSDVTPNRLIGVNVAGNPATATNTINGKVPLRAFAPPWPANRGFGPHGYYYYPNVHLRGGLGTSGSRVMQEVSAAGHKGLVYFASHYNTNGGQTNDSATSSFTGGGPANPTAWNDYGAYGAEVFVMDTSVGGQPFQLTNLGSQSNLRQITYLQTNRAGDRLAFLHNASVNNNCCAWTGYSHMPNSEQVVLITNVTTNATTGALTAAAVQTLEGTAGRAGVSMAFDFTDSRLYYAFTTGSAEGAQVLFEKKFDPFTGAVTGTRQQAPKQAATNRLAVLNSGR